jgi:hypothetical protein
VALTSLEAVMQRFAELILRLLEVQSDGRHRSPELVAEDERLMESLQKRYQAINLRQRMELGRDSMG